MSFKGTWEVSELGKEAFNASRPFSFRENENVVFINTGDVLSGKFLHQKISKHDGLPGQAKKSLKKNDILLSEIRPANCRFAYIDFDAKNYVVSTKFMVLETRGRISPRFLYHVLTNQITLNEFQRIAESRSGTFPQITFDSISHFPIPVPPIEDQVNLVDFLDAMQSRLNLLRETNITLEAIAQALFKSWFVDFDPVRAKQEGREPDGVDAETAGLFPDSFEESELGVVPTGWVVSSLGAICTKNSGAIQTGPFGSQLHASDYLEDGIPVVMPQDLAGRRVQIEKIARIGEDDVKRLTRHQLRLSDIVFSRRGDVGRHALIGLREAGWLCGTGCLLVRPGDTWPSAIYLSLALDREDSKAWLLRHAVGATMPNINTGILSAVPILQPSTEVLHAFNDVVIVLDGRISSNHTQIRLLSEIRDILLPRLISGQLPLREAIETVAALVTGT